ncbi:hypothetical protein [Streptomyces sp. NPDC002845]
METEAEYGFIVNLDAQGSGLLTDSEKPDMRRRLYEVSGKAFEQADIRAPRLYQEDRGDGILCILRATVPPRRVVGEWLEYLHQNLRESNRGLKTPLRLRVGMHIGPVTADPHGRSGRAVDLACRLGDCATTKAVLAAAPGSPLVAAVSATVYEDVVQAGGRWVEPGHYRAFDVELKEGRRTAWFLVPGLPEPPLPDHSTASPTPGTPSDAPGTAVRQGEREEREETARRTVVNHNYGSGEFYSNEHVGTININKYASPADGER